jgi:hypothetical protein
MDSIHMAVLKKRVNISKNTNGEKIRFVMRSDTTFEDTKKSMYTKLYGVNDSGDIIIKCFYANIKKKIHHDYIEENQEQVGHEITEDDGELVELELFDRDETIFVIEQDMIKFIVASDQYKPVFIRRGTPLDKIKLHMYTSLQYEESQGLDIFVLMNNGQHRVPLEHELEKIYKDIRINEIIVGLMKKSNRHAPS